MKITPKILSIPPHLSVAWSQIRALYTKEGVLTVSLTDGTAIPLPSLSSEERETLFQAHSAFGGESVAKTASASGQPTSLQFIQAHPLGSQPQGKDSSELSANGTVRFGFENLEPFQSAMQHNPALAHIQNMPKEILDKIAGVAKVLAPGEISDMPKAEPHCNCPHCQIARAIHGETAKPADLEVTIQDEQKEELVTDDELKFSEWDISQFDEHQYVVTNRLDTNEQYRVFLGEPVGCTCGKSGCDHILAVLKS